MIFMCLIEAINTIKDAILVSLVLIFRIKTKRFYFGYSLNIIFRLASKWALEAIGF